MPFDAIRQKLLRDLPTPDSSPREVADYSDFAQKSALAALDVLVCGDEFGPVPRTTVKRARRSATLLEDLEARAERDLSLDVAQRPGE